MDSELNPEAPEFHPLPDPEIITTVEDGYKHMKQATNISNTFPIGPSYNLFQTYTDFNVVICKVRKNIICLSSNIMVVEVPSVELKSDNNESNSEILVDVNDQMLDRINIHIDTTTGVNRPAAVVMNSPQPAAWNHKPLVTTVKTTSGSAALISAKNIPRPQLSFKEPVDNSDKLFLPRIHDKPNSIQPLALTVIYDEAGNPIGYEHPYQTELRMYSPPPWAMVPGPEPEFPPALERAPATLVDTPPQLDALVRHLAAVREIAVDLEHHSYRTYQGITCLIQISTDEGGDFIVDALALRDHLHALNESFTDPSKVKVFHGAEQDVQWLQRDFGVYVVGLFDTHQAARLLRLNGLALRHLLNKYCSIDVDKTYQLADWRIRPLPEALIRYARTDTHYLLYVWRRMRTELLHLDPALLWNVFARSAQVAATTYEKPRLTDESHMPVYLRSGKRFTRAQMTALRAAWAWRDAHARELDESPAYLAPNHLLLAAAEALPRDLQGLRALADPTPPFLNRNLEALHRIILASREVPEEPQVLSMPASVLAMTTAPLRDAIHVAHDLTSVSPRERESEWEAGEVAASAPDVTSPDMHPFTAPVLPWLTPPASPNEHTAELAAGKKSQLNVNAQTFVPPYARYKMYRVISQAEEIKALKEKEARVAALGRDSEVIRQEVLPELQPLRIDPTAEEKPLRNSTAEKKPRRVSTSDKKPRRDSATESTATADLEVRATTQERDGEVDNNQRKRKRQDKHDAKNATKTTETDVCKDNKNKNNVRPYNYKNSNYEMFCREDGKRKKHPNTK